MCGFENATKDSLQSLTHSKRATGFPLQCPLTLFVGRKVQLDKNCAWESRKIYFYHFPLSQKTATYNESVLAVSWKYDGCFLLKFPSAFLTTRGSALSCIRRVPIKRNFSFIFTSAFTPSLFHARTLRHLFINFFVVKEFMSILHIFQFFFI